MKIAKYLLVLLGMWVLVGVTDARADSISTTVEITTVGGTQCSNSGPSSATCSIGPANFLNAVGSASAVGTLSAGTIGAQGQTTITQPFVRNGSIPFADDATSVAVAIMTYNFSITGGPSSGILALPVSVSGTSQVTYNGCGPANSCLGNAGATLTSIQLLNGLQVGFSQTVLASGATSLVIQIPYSQSIVPTESLDLTVSAQCSDFSSLASPTSCNSSSNFLDTVQITGAQVFDSAGSLVPGAIVTSQSGFNPNGVPVPTPEPSSLTLLVSGLAVIGTLRRKFRFTSPARSC